MHIVPKALLILALWFFFGTIPEILRYCIRNSELKVIDHIFWAASAVYIVAYFAR